MLYLKRFENSKPEVVELLDSCKKLHSDPMFFTDTSGTVIGCNVQFASLLRIDDLHDVPPVADWLKTGENALESILSTEGTYRGKLVISGNETEMQITVAPLKVEQEEIIGVVLRDVSIIEKAKAAERYFEQFKNKFLTNISHEFRTPMNAIIGFSDLLKNTPLDPAQREYVDMTSRSAFSMMRNIENLLELMQVESGNVHAHQSLYNPLEVYEAFSQQFSDLAASKNIQIMFLIDPHLPKTMMGDEDKILAVLRNLIQNAIKFTHEGGRVLVEILVTAQNDGAVEVEYAVGDTGSGIDPERVKTLLRPFASAWENQRRGKDGLGIGLSLSHKYVNMMESHLMLASEVGKGSRFSFRIRHNVMDEGQFDFVSGTKAAIYTQNNYLSINGALVSRYLTLFGVETMVIHELVHESLPGENILFLDTVDITPSHVQAVQGAYPNLKVIPILKVDYGLDMQPLINIVDSVVTVPILPSTLHKTLAVVWKTMPKDYIAQSAEVQHVPRQENLKLLVAEDNLINLRLLETILLQEGFKVVAVDNGQKAVDAYLKDKFDLVLMDIDMPIMDGLTANRLIKEIDKRDGRGFVPVIALTAHALLGDRERIIAAGLDAHLAKPIDKHFLLQTIDRYLKLSQQKQKNGSV